MRESTEQVYRQRILRVQMYIQQNLDRELPLEELAKESYFSEYHFHRMFRAIGGGEYAVTTHFGPYNKLSQTYHRLFGQWLLQSDRELRSEPCMEFYLNDPESTEPEDLLTDICLPLKT